VKDIVYTPARYWDRRYREGRTSGAGSEGVEGYYKAEYVNDFIHENAVTSVIDWGCGDGQVLELLKVGPSHSPYVAYTGIDVSPTILERNRQRFREFVFATPDEANVSETQWRAELALSMDVLFHLPDDHDYHSYLGHLFDSATRYVLIYSTNHAGGRTARHVLRREFTPDVAKYFTEWRLKTVETPLREGLASFFVYERIV
jgi:trans-aconitate methyltransferase